MTIARGVVLLALAQAMAGCGGSTLSGPTQELAATTAVVVPSVTAITPAMGSTGGFTWLKVSGTGFQPGATVTLGGITVNGRFDSRDRDGKTLYLESPAHAAGDVDVVVANPGGQTGTLPAGYAYALPQSFDFNGTWWGFSNQGQDIPLGFTIENNALTSVWCDTFAILTFSPPLPLSDGAFAFSKDNHVVVSGAIVAAAAAHGTINLADCTETTWVATRK